MTDPAPVCAAGSLESTAYHEAGHAVAHRVLGLAIHEVSIKPEKRGEDETLGRVRGGKLIGSILGAHELEFGSLSMRQRAHVERHVMALLAGHEAEHVATGAFNAAGAEHDYRLASELVLAMSGSILEHDTYTEWLGARTKTLVRVHWTEVAALSDELLRRQTMRGREVHDFFRARAERELAAISTQIAVVTANVSIEKPSRDDGAGSAGEMSALAESIYFSDELQRLGAKGLQRLRASGELTETDYGTLADELRLRRNLPRWR